VSISFIKVQNGVVIHFEKIGPDPPPPNNEKGDDNFKEDGDLIGGIEPGGDNSLDNDKLQANPLPNTSWHNCRKMIYVPRTNQKGYSLGK
jgi:integrator complex subunit 6